MLIKNINTVVVINSTELKYALEQDNGYTYIYLGNNINLTEQIAICPNKSNIIIDGTYNGKLYEFSDQKKSGTTDGIYITSPFTTKVTVKNMNITGFNSFGIIYVPEDVAFTNTVIEYSYINYTGPRLSYNVYGTTRLIDVTITIQDNYNKALEVAKCNKVEIGGSSNIIHNSNSSSIFYFSYSNPSIIILQDAYVYFMSSKRELFCGTYDLNFTVSKGASLYISTYNGLAYKTYGTKNALISENALLSITQTNYTEGYATWYNYGNITLNNNSSLEIISNSDKITSSNYNIYFSGNNTSFILNNPKKVVLYNLLTNVIYTDGTCNFEFTFNRLNLFNKTLSMESNISKDTLPDFSWYKNNLSYISGTFTNAITNISDTNFTEEELKLLPSLDNFNLNYCKILSLGLFIFSINSLTDTDLEITGLTEAYSSVLIEYNNVAVTVEANESGVFTHSYTNYLSPNTKVNLTVKSYNSVLYYAKQIEVVYNGELYIAEASVNVQFDIYAISTNPLFCPRLTDLSINVIDGRLNSSNWKLYASINHDLTSKKGDVLENSLVFVDSNGNISTLSSTPTLVYTGTANSGKLLSTKVRWNKKEGILLRILEPLENNTIYDTEIIWSIRE